MLHEGGVVCLYLVLHKATIIRQVDLSSACCVVSHFESLRCEDEANLVLTGCLAADQNPWTHSELIHLKIIFEAFV